jgi:hypothetical protein
MSTARALLRWQLHVAHDLLDGATRPLTPESVRSGPAAGAAARYAAVLLCEDLTVNGVLAAGQPLALTTWAGRTGVSELPSLAVPIDWQAWIRRVRLDLVRLRPYALAIRAATDAYLAGLSDEAFEAAPACLLTALLMDLSVRRGEIGLLLSATT